MTQWNIGNDTYDLSYDEENHLIGVSGTVTATYGYDGDGKRVLATQGVTTTVFIGNYYEMAVSGEISSTVNYYYAGAVRLAMRDNEGDVQWLLGGHLGSTSLVYDGSETVRQGYKAWGERRFILGGEELPTTFRYTGQREEEGIGLYYYGARWYDPGLGRWIQPDSIVPLQKQGPQGFDRFAYVNNNPLQYIDPSGHDYELWYFDKHGKLPPRDNYDGSILKTSESLKERASRFLILFLITESIEIIILGTSTAVTAAVILAPDPVSKIIILGVDIALISTELVVIYSKMSLVHWVVTGEKIESIEDLKDWEWQP